MKNLSFCVDRSFFKGLPSYLLCFSLLGAVSSPNAVNAQTLPPPPTIRVPSRPPKAAPVPPTSTSVTTPETVEVPVSTPTSIPTSPSQGESVREFTFQAPSDSVPTPATSSGNGQPSIAPTSTIKANFYRVEVSASDETTLEAVKAIEPFAFWQREQQVVYAGRFHQKDQAEQRVQELTQRGLSAQIVPVNQ